MNGLDRLGLALNGLVCLLVAGVWSLPTLLNGFPLSYYDSAFYVYNTFHLLEPASIAWRPLTYSLFLRGPFEIVGFVGIIFIQNLLVAGFLFKFSKLIWIQITRKVFFLMALILVITPLVHVGNFIMPDLFSPLAIFAMIGFFYCESKERIFYFLATAFFSFMHFSNFICVVPLLIFHFSKNYRKSLFAIVSIFFIVLSVRFLFFFPKKSFEESAHYFVFSRFVAFEVFDSYLDDACPDTDLIFCQKENRNFAIWNNTRSPNSVAPGMNVLPSVVKANQSMLKSKLIWSYFFKGMSQSLLQATLFSTPMPVILDDITLYRQYGKYAGDSSMMAFANQKIFNNKKFPLKAYSKMSSNVFFISSIVSLVALLFLFFRNLLYDEEKKIIFYYTSAYLLNCIAIGFLSEPLSRYNSKLIWGFGFLALIFIAKSIAEKKRNWVVQLSGN